MMNINTRKKLYLNWSTGKDSALALYYLQQDDQWHVDHLLTTISHLDRVTMHGLRRELLEAQIRELNLPVTIMEMPDTPSMEVYNSLMQEKMTEFTGKGYRYSAFGDIFLQDLRAYREGQLARQAIQAVFPLWGKDTHQLMYDFFSLGFKAVVVAASSDFFDKDFVGRVVDKDLIKDLPKEVDPCGENGEFHTFCFDGPIFKNPINFSINEKVYKSYKSPKSAEKEAGFWFADLILA